MDPFASASRDFCELMLVVLLCTLTLKLFFLPVLLALLHVKLFFMVEELL